jgi:hypothetical protein
MAERKAGKKGGSKSAQGLTAEEKQAMREAVKERKLGTSRAEGDKAVRAKIAKMPQPDRAMAERLYKVMGEAAPSLVPRTWYGMPAFSKDDEVICFFQVASMFKARFTTVGFSDKARLDEGRMWPTGFALTELTPAEEARIASLVKKAVG